MRVAMLLGVLLVGCGVDAPGLGGDWVSERAELSLGSGTYLRAEKAQREEGEMVVVGDVLTLRPTRLECPGDLAPRAFTFTLDGDQLRLTSGGETEVYRRMEEIHVPTVRPLLRCP